VIAGLGLIIAAGVIAQVNGLCQHSLRATAATNALSQGNIAKVNEWLSHANISTTGPMKCNATASVTPAAD
jgi:hypothetical protein